MMKRAIPLAMGACLLLGAPLARAQTTDLKKECSVEISKYCPEATNNEDIQRCLEKREELGKKKSGLSKKCYQAHEKLESPAEEKAEHQKRGEPEEHEHEQAQPQEAQPTK